MKSKVLIMVFLLSLLQGCAFSDFFRKRDDPIIPPDVKVKLDPKALEPCASLPILTDRTPEGLLTNTQNIVLTYYDCAKKQENSIILLKGFSNAEH